jgi:hypothetical protein
MDVAAERAQLNTQTGVFVDWNVGGAECFGVRLNAD